MMCAYFYCRIKLVRGKKEELHTTHVGIFPLTPIYLCCVCAPGSRR